MEYTTVLRLHAELGDLHDREKWHTGLRLHLQYAHLTTYLMHIDGEQRCYVKLNGCAGCAVGQCAAGCRTALLRRLVTACFAPATALRVIPRGLAPQHSTYTVLAWPTRTAQPLDAFPVEQWTHAVLTMHWQAHTQSPRSYVILQTNSAGIPPEQTFAPCGWKGIRLPTGKVTPMFAAINTFSLTLPRRTAHIVAFPLPTNDTQHSVAPTRHAVPHEVA